MRVVHIIDQLHDLPNHDESVAKLLRITTHFLGNLGPDPDIVSKRKGTHDVTWHVTVLMF